MKIFYTIQSIRSYLKNFSDQKIGLVPTMGALHSGHLSLIAKAKTTCDIVVVSIFVNQKQFNNPEDYALYPSTLEQDIKLLESNGVDILFAPAPTEIYHQNFATQIIIAKLTDYLCGKSRVGHFDGVALIVSKLFNIIKPTRAFFGEKDFQQLQIIRRLVSDLNIDVEIIAGSTLREIDGLAMSSRNLRLSPESRKIAGQIYDNLCLAKEKIIKPSKLANNNLAEILLQTTKDLLQIGADKIDYLEVCDEENLQPLKAYDSAIKSRLFIAIYVGEIRLIDNIEL